MCASLGREISSQKLHSACLPTAFFCNVQTGNARGLRTYQYLYRSLFRDYETKDNILYIKYTHRYSREVIFTEMRNA